MNTEGWYILEMAASTNFNVGNVSTFHFSGYGEAFLNTFLASEDIFTWIFDWRVAEVYTATLFRINPSESNHNEEHSVFCPAMETSVMLMA